MMYQWLEEEHSKCDDNAFFEMKKTDSCLKTKKTSSTVNTQQIPGFVYPRAIF